PGSRAAKGTPLPVLPRRPPNAAAFTRIACAVSSIHAPSGDQSANAKLPRSCERPRGCYCGLHYCSAMMGGRVRAWCHCLLLACIALAPLAANAQQVKLRITAQLPATNHLVVNVKQFKDDVEAKTQGAIQVEIFDNGRLFKEDQALSAVESGAIEMGSVGVSF